MDVNATSIAGWLVAGVLLVVPAAAAAPPDVAPWAEFLAARVDAEGLVEYRSLSEVDLERLGEFLLSLGEIDPETLGSDDAVAFWLNAYNALVVLGIAHGYDPARLEDRARLYHWLAVEVGGRSRTLDEIRETLGRYAARDPRIHFAACNGTLGSPPLAREPYEGVTLQAQLARAARRFVNDERWNQIDVPARRVVLSPLFRWYRSDFERAEGSIRRYVAGLLPDPKIASIVRRKETKIRFATFDWRANARGTGDSASE